MFTTDNIQQNGILAALPEAVQKRLAPNLKLVDLRQGMVLYEGGDKLSHVYFPTEAIISKVYVTESGGSAEISIVGNEGMIGVSLFMGGEYAPGQAIVLRAGHALQLPRQAFMAEYDRHGELQQQLLHYIQARLAQIAQTAVCNRHHTIDQQLCRWLLFFLDRLPEDSLETTQEMIANMLGVRREGVTEAAGKLQRQGVIEYHRGKITVIDRPKLENLSCECYAVVRKEIDWLISRDSNPRPPP